MCSFFSILFYKTFRVIFSQFWSRKPDLSTKTEGKWTFSSDQIYTLPSKTYVSQFPNSVADRNLLICTTCLRYFHSFMKLEGNALSKCDGQTEMTTQLNWRRPNQPSNPKQNLYKNKFELSDMHSKWHSNSGDFNLVTTQPV